MKAEINYRTRGGDNVRLRVTYRPAGARIAVHAVHAVNTGQLWQPTQKLADAIGREFEAGRVVPCG